MYNPRLVIQSKRVTRLEKLLAIGERDCAVSKPSIYPSTYIHLGGAVTGVSPV